ncbi:Uncharacterised protein [Weissella viridescens]|uniref:Uncharacterized protein n=1 Tax=Weissella viridescens TaxID=1629 RepID=A0A380P3J4_WEIVI|nr:Uncharacterised protein [Weissella viridescens]
MKQVYEGASMPIADVYRQINKKLVRVLTLTPVIARVPTLFMKF